MGTYPVGFGNFISSDGVIPTEISSLRMENEGISIYPNPFFNKTQISFTEVQENAVVKIIDLRGNVMKRILCNGKILNIDRSDLRNGVYFLQITDSHQKTMSKKIIIQ